MPNAHEPQGARAVFITRLPQSLLDELDRIAYANGHTRTEAVCHAIAAYIGATYTPTRATTPRPSKYANPTAKVIARRAQVNAAVRSHRERKAQSEARANKSKSNL